MTKLVKVWFKNRRAKDRKKSQDVSLPNGSKSTQKAADGCKPDSSNDNDPDLDGDNSLSEGNETVYSTSPSPGSTCNNTKVGSGTKRKLAAETVKSHNGSQQEKVFV
jgi:hypothetical protein